MAQQPVGPIPLAGAFEQQRKKNLRIATVLVCLAALLAGGMALKSMGILGGNDHGPNDPSLVAKATGPSSELVLPATNNNSPMVMPATAPEGMPDDIYQWLEHLRRCEEKRTDMTLEHLTTAYTEKEKSQVEGGVDAIKNLLNGIDDPNSEMHPPTEALAKVMKKMHDDVRDLNDFFDSVPPPKECIPIRDAYDQALGEEAGQMGDIADHLASGDVNKLLKMEGKSASGIDSAGAKTDRLVGEICDKYHKRRWFSIATDIKSSSIFGSGF